MNGPAVTTVAPTPLLRAPWLQHPGWKCRRLDLRGDNEITGRFEAEHSPDYVEVHVVPRDARGAHRLEHCAVRYKAGIGSKGSVDRARVGAVVMDMAAAVNSRLATAPGASMAEAFGRRLDRTPVVLSASSLLDLIAPDIVPGAEILDGWKLAGVRPARELETDALQLALEFRRVRVQQPLILFVTGRTPGLQARATSAHLALVQQSGAPAGADAVVALVAFLLQVRDHEQLDLTVPADLRGRAPAVNGDGATHPDEWDQELARLRQQVEAKNIACLRPWTTAERLGGWQVLPCCQRFLRQEVLDQCDRDTTSFVEAWNAPGLKAVRRAMAAGTPLDTCREDCPTFHGDNRAEVDWLFQTPTSREAYENTVKVVHEILDGVEHVESTPPSVTFTVEQNCNIRCVMCSVVFGGPEIEGTPRVLSAAGAEELIPLFPKIRSLALMGGEPTLAPVTRELLARYDAERYPDATAFMTTNGLLLTPKYTAAFRKTRLNVMISINAATPETYEHITGRRGGFERVVENIRALLDPQTGPEHRPVIMLSFVVMKDTYREVPDFLRLAQELGTTVRLQAVYGELGGQSIFTDEALLTTVSEFFDREVLPVLPVYPKNYQVSAERLAHIMKSRLERRDFTPY